MLDIVTALNRNFGCFFLPEIAPLLQLRDWCHAETVAGDDKLSAGGERRHAGYISRRELYGIRISRDEERGKGTSEALVVEAVLLLHSVY